MFKKLALVGLGVLLVGGLVFGNRLVPYAHTAWNKVRASAQQSVPISFQIDAAKQQLERITPEIRDMVWKIAREKADIKRLDRELETQTVALEKKRNEMMALRDHLSGDEEVYVATNGKSYTSTRVEEDLRHRFSIYQTAEQTREKTAQILELRQNALETAMTRLEQAQAQQRELEIQVENLNARERMVEVARSASSINLDDSQIARTRQLIDEISSHIDAEEEMLELAPKYLGEIPVSTDSLSNEAQGDIVEQIDAYFSKPASSTDNSVVSVK